MASRSEGKATNQAQEAAGGRKWARGSGETQAEEKRHRKFTEKLKSEVYPEGRIETITSALPPFIIPVCL